MKTFFTKISQKFQPTSLIEKTLTWFTQGFKKHILKVIAGILSASFILCLIDIYHYFLSHNMSWGIILWEFAIYIMVSLGLFTFIAFILGCMLSGREYYEENRQKKILSWLIENKDNKDVRDALIKMDLIEKCQLEPHSILNDTTFDALLDSLDKTEIAHDKISEMSFILVNPDTMQKYFRQYEHLTEKNNDELKEEVKRHIAKNLKDYDATQTRKNALLSQYYPCDTNYLETKEIFKSDKKLTMHI